MIPGECVEDHPESIGGVGLSDVVEIDCACEVSSVYSGVSVLLVAV